MSFAPMRMVVVLSDMVRPPSGSDNDNVPSADTSGVPSRALRCQGVPCGVRLGYNILSKNQEKNYELANIRLKAQHQISCKKSSVMTY